MRPLPGLLACVGTLLLLTLILTLRHAEPAHGPTAAGQAPPSRSRQLRSFFNFRSPESFFPPSAIISLTDDNSTFFVARPAYYGPSLPPDGLSGQLWIGSGFGEDAATGRLDWSAEGELGCSDIQGGPDIGGPQNRDDSKAKNHTNVKAGARRRMSPDGSMPSIGRGLKERGYNTRTGRPELDDGTDDHLHWPMKGRPLDKAVNMINTKTIENTHADIRSIQQEAEIAGKVVLLSRGGCGFLEKTKWVQRRGGVGLIVGNNIPDPVLVSMYASEDTSNVTIPSVFTSYMSAHLLSSLIPSGGYLKGGHIKSDGTTNAVAETNPTDSHLTSIAADGTTSNTKTKTFAGGNVVPGSGHYLVPGEAAVLSNEERSSAQATQGTAAAQKHKHIPQPLPPLIHTPDPREGLWITITPATASSSFFDTLLVLVVSPLVTLTVVYALLLLRAHIQRRRWRAPKSVVERLPVRVYHTMSSSSTPTSAHTPSLGNVSPTTPLLQADHSSALSQSRPRSRTGMVSPESAAATLDRQRNEVASRVEKRRYQGKQVECVVCLEEYVDGESQVMSLPCGHEFHADCITPWLTTRRRTCPICKGDVVRSLAESSESEQSNSRATSSGSGLNASPGHSEHVRSGPREDHERVLDGDLERGRSVSRSPMRANWRPWSAWWSNRHDDDRSEAVDRDHRE